MSAILYYLFIYPLSLLPMWFLYGISKFVLCPLAKVIGFRKRVIVENIANSFPQKTAEERQQLVRTFYLHFTDLVVESVKGFTISEALATEKMTYENTALLNDLHKKGKSIVLVGGHYGNWELLAVTIAQSVKHSIKALYTPLANTFFDAKMRETRSKFGLEMLPISRAKSIFEEKDHQPIAVIFGSDQSPRNAAKAYWLTFLNQETGVQFGAEKFAKEYDCAVVFGQIHRVSRGHFKTTFSLICEDAAQMPYGKITEIHTKLLEAKIIADPSFWLWSHRRWKRKRPADVVLH